MLLCLRYGSSLVRTRRRIPFLLVVGIVLCCFCLTFIIQYHPSRRKTINDETLLVDEANDEWPTDEQGRSLKKRFLVLDWTGFFGSVQNEREEVSCASSQTTFVWTLNKQRIHEIDFLVSHDVQAAVATNALKTLQVNSEKQQYSMAFIMESEVHSSTGVSWTNFNFQMSYNLDESYPEPATYFDMNTYLIDLLMPLKIPFENREQSADIVWIITNCNAHNGREQFVKELMKEIRIDSFGPCLNNRQGYQSRMLDNIDAYKKYKFVLAIENSNCFDYVTEKLVKVVSAGAIPIVAGRFSRPDYRRFMPDHSFVNIFDYSSVKDLANDLKRIANNKSLYESFHWFRKHDKDVEQLQMLSLETKLKVFTELIGSNSTMITDGIVMKEKSENKICKLIRFVRQTPWQEIVHHNRTARADPQTACLPLHHIPAHFNIH